MCNECDLEQIDRHHLTVLYYHDADKQTFAHVEYCPHHPPPSLSTIKCLCCECGGDCNGLNPRELVHTVIGTTAYVQLVALCSEKCFHSYAIKHCPVVRSGLCYK